MANNKIYLIGRLLTVASKPLCLFLANNYGSSHTSAGVAEIFLVSVLTIGWISADPHRRYYKLLYKANSKSAVVAFNKYVTSILVLLIIGSAIVFASIFNFSTSLLYSAICVPYFISEKIADEILRFKLFESDFIGWGSICAKRGILQIFSMLLLVFMLGDEINAELIIFTFSVINFSVLHKELPIKYSNSNSKRRILLLIKSAPRAVKLMMSDWILLAITILNSAIRYMDRISIVFINSEVLPTFSLLVMCFSALPLIVDFFYVSRHRKDFLEGNLTQKQAIQSKGFLFSFIQGLIVSFTLVFTVLYFSKNSELLTAQHKFSVASMSTATTLVSISQQILYWNHYLKKILTIDFFFCIAFLVIISISYNPSIENDNIFVLLGFCAIARALIYFFVASNENNRLHV